MGNRLSKIATRTGDDGTTGLGDGSRVRKDDARIAAIGDVDELNSQLGVLLAEPLPDDVRAALSSIQHDLFDLGGELCIPGHAAITDAHLARLDDWLAHYNAQLPPLEEFILPAARAARRSRTYAGPSAGARSARSSRSACTRRSTRRRAAT
ncbi:putative cob(I)alamin adenosyltransferase [Burkholderia pseudomallei MSHR2990]|nr:putative cob(I)alamin adenosyltransferase [Burkholderia pseudomallei MSHR2990]